MKPFWKSLIHTAGVCLLLSPGLVQATLQLQHLSTAYLPSNNEEPRYADDAVIAVAFDPERNVTYSVGKEVSHVTLVTSDGDLDPVLAEYEDDVEFSDVEVCGDYVFTTVRDRKHPEDGFLRVYSAFDGETWPVVLEVEVGANPASLAVTSDCSMAVVAVEAEAYEEDDELEDPEGLVVIVKFPSDMDEDEVTVTSLDFEDFNDKIEELEETGVRFIYREDGNEFSNDVEPEDVTIDEDNKRAFVSLQENNGVAEIDLVSETITAIHGLGYKQWGYLDASDEDKGVEITYWPIRAWYQPDNLRHYQWMGQHLIFTANEGAFKEYEGEDFKDFDEATRGIDEKDLADDIHSIIADSIENDAELGRLQFSKYDGLDESGDKYENLYTFGGRSFSVWGVPDSSTVTEGVSILDQIYDSESDLEQLTGLYCPHLFNTDGDKVDERSDNQGPEPEAITVAEIYGRLYIFLAVERPGIIFVYSIGSDVTKPRFETIFCDGIPDDSRDMEELFDDREIFGVDPEQIKFYPADQSPTGRPMLVISGRVSGTVTLLDVLVEDEREETTTSAQVTTVKDAEPATTAQVTTVKDAEPASSTTQFTTTLTDDSSGLLASGFPQELVDTVPHIYLLVFDDTCYYFEIMYQEDFDTASSICDLNNGTLELPTTPEVNAFLLQTLAQDLGHYDPVWIGFLPSSGETTVLEWDDGSVNDLTQFDGDDEDCIALDPATGYWLDYACAGSDEKGFVCQFPATLSDECPEFNCPDLDCEMNGYQVDENQCMLCLCNEV